MTQKITIVTTEEEFDMLRERGFPPVQGFQYVDDTEIGHDNHGDIELQLVIQEVTTGRLFAGVYGLHAGEGFVTFTPDEYVPVTRKEKTVTVVYYE